MEAATVDLDTPAGVLSAVRTDRALVDAGEARMLQAAVAWAALHSVDSITHAATYHDFGGDTGMPVAGPGAPLVSEFSIVEFAAAIGLPTEAGKAYLGEAVELRYRLPRLWARVVSGDLQAWKARKVAKATIVLSAEAAVYVDRHLAPVAHKVGPTQTDRLIDEAIARFMPDEAERRRKQAADGRRLDIDTRQASLQGTATVYGELDVADALDLDTALSAGAEALKNLGSTDSLDVRRAVAAGELARRQLALDLNTPHRRPGHRRGHRRSRPRRRRGSPASRGRWCSTCTSPGPRSPHRPPRSTRSAGSRTRGPRSPPSRSGCGAGTRTPRWW